MVLAVLVVAALGAGYLAVSSGRQASTSTSTSQGASSSIPGPSEVSSSNVTIPRPPPSTQGLTLNSIAYTQGIVQGRLIVPNASILGSGWSIKGAAIAVAPQNVTTSNGIVFNDWAINIFISNGQFINGTTSDSALLGDSVIVTEGSNPGFYNSSEAAQQYISPDQICTTTTLSNNATSSTCSAGPASPLKIVQMGSTYLAVDQNAPNAYFQVDGKNVTVQISGDLTYSQVLALAEGIIQSPSTSQTSTTSNTSASLLPGCTQPVARPTYGANITLSPGQTLNFCVELYYYSATGSPPATVDLASFASLESLFDSHLHSALANFTMTYSTAQGPSTPASVQIGGPSNENEGFLVEYQITPKLGITNGAYGLNLAAYEGPSPGGALEMCTTDFLIVLGDGVPNYDNVGSCILAVGSPQSPGLPYIPNTLVATGFGVSYTNG
ncbi:MAG: hypothetical protein OK449_05660 [Thaumarchaeota archaeon]|nr:hypothetical protein [Nitrososphaerota archaeon]